MNVRLQIRQSATDNSSPAAWFLPGDSVERWLEELARCGLAVAETRLYAVPRSSADRSPAGLLVVPAVSNVPWQPPSGMACRVIAGRLIVPSEATLQPPVTDAEVRALCPLPVTFLHPTLGLSGFDEDSTLRVWDLIDLPQEKIGRWNCAQPGATPLPKLSAVQLAQPPAIENLFGGAEQEIGSEPPEDLPPAPDEPGEGALSESQRRLKRLLAKSMADALRKLPHTGSRRTWVNKLEEWAQRQLSGANEQLEKMRHREIHRLLHLFETDPEAGLRHAIPMNNFGHRGVAPPGGKLGEHNPEFNSQNLGGRPVDGWNVPLDLQEILRLRYREMADREMQLGRHRRAAYIYAELLGDLVSSAHALKQGRWFREAALLYEEHLRNPLEAARCLAEGGLLAEASERYEKLGRWPEVAELQERLGNAAAAQAAWRQVVNEHLGRHDFIGASKLLEERLHAPDEAVAALAEAWPGSAQAGGSVSALFQLYSKLGRHVAAQERLDRIAHEPVPASLTVPLLIALSGPVQQYPHAPVRHHAADFSRVLVARRLSQANLSTDEAARLMECLSRLAPHDHLLARDANRHLAVRRENQLRAHRLNPPPLPGRKPVVLRRFELPRQIQWLQLRTAGQWFFAAGVSDRHLLIVRGIWEGELQSLSWLCPSEAVRKGLMFELAGEDGSALAVATLSGPPLARKSFPPSNLGRECVVETPSWLPPQGFPFAIGDDAVWSVHVAAYRAIVSCHDRRGKLLRTIDMTEDLLGGAERTGNTRLCLTVLASGVAVALGNRLVVSAGNHALNLQTLPGQVTGMIATPRHTRQGVAVMLEHGAAMYWLGAADCIELDADIASPKGAFVPGGPLVMISDSQTLLLDVDTRGVRSVTRMELTGQRIVGVGATGSQGEFATLGERGEMTIYRGPNIEQPTSNIEI